MKARVFLSCGQNKKSKREMAAINAIVEALENVLGLTVFVAAKENFFVGNPNIFDSLKDSDYYLFINFERPVKMTGCYCSLYTHQELAMAIAYGFDKTNMLVFHKKGMQKSGILKYMFANGEFKDYSDVAEVVIKAVQDNKWHSSYSRKLVIRSAFLNQGESIWTDSFGRHIQRRERIAIVEILNRRNDYAATNCQVHLKHIDGPYTFFDRAPVKAAGMKAYSHTIWPGETVQFDLFGYDVDKNSIFMHTECDVTSNGLRRPLFGAPGDFIMTYEVYAEHFPVSTFDVKVHLGKNKDEIAFSLFQPTQHTYCSTDPTDSFRNYPSTGGEPTGTGALSTSYPNPDI